MFEGPNGRVEAVRDLTCEIAPEKINVIIGPSGCGKSTLLNAIAGLLPETARVSGQLELSAGIRLGYVFQRDALVPWRTVVGNAETGLEIARMPKPERRSRAMDWIHRMGLGGFENYYPHQLSGGMRQRVALIRTLVCEPDLILMDEPFGALDAQTRLLIQNELVRIWRETRKTILLVTHDLAEAVLLAHRLFVMTRQPSRIRQAYEIELPEPRDAYETRITDEFDRIFKEIWQVLRAEVTEIHLLKRGQKAP